MIVIWPPRAICSQSQWAARIYELFPTNSVCVCGREGQIQLLFIFIKHLDLFFKHCKFDETPNAVCQTRFLSNWENDVNVKRNCKRWCWCIYSYVTSPMCWSDQYPRFPESAKTNKNVYKLSYTNIITQTYLSSYSVQNQTDVGTLGKCVLSPLISTFISESTEWMPPWLLIIILNMYSAFFKPVKCFLTQYCYL